MRYSSNIENSSYSALSKNGNYNSVEGGSGTVATPDQLGIPITKSVFGLKYPGGPKISNGGAAGNNTAANNWIDTYGMPFIFVVNGNQILLPPVVQQKNTPVPYLPDGISVIYAPSFMGVPIPSDFFKPISVNGKLRLDKVEMPSAQGVYKSLDKGAVGSPSSAVMISNSVDTGVNQGQTLLYLLISVMECLIYSYSSNPWGNGYLDIAHTCMTQRNLDDWLIYPYQKGTFLGTIVKDIAPIYTNVISPIVGAIVPGTAGIAGATAKAISNAVANANKPATNNVGAGLTTTVIPSQKNLVDANGNVLQHSSSVPASGSSSTLLIIALVAVVLIIIIVIAVN